MRSLDVLATLLALLGAALGTEAWLAGSLWRYQLVGLVVGTTLCLPGAAILLLRDRARRLLRRVLFALAPLIVLLLLAELGMRLFGAAPLPAEVLVADDRLGYVLAPGSGGTDALGFRNERVPDQVDALFVGDSQTWGFYLDAQQAFPAQFAAATGSSSYQMANGGYGPVQYRELVRRGLALQPKLVVVGFYFGNDLVEAAGSAYLDGAEDLRVANRTYDKPVHQDLLGKRSPNWTFAFVDWMRAESRLFGWAANVVRSWLDSSMTTLDAQPGAVLFPDDAVATVLLPGYRLGLLDLNNEWVAEGMRITALCLRDIAAQCKAAHARCLLLAIPTKVYCYAEWQRQLGKPLATLEGLHAAETAARAQLFAAANAGGLELLDLAPVCIAALRTGTPIWARNGDGHLMVNGHLAAARAIAEIWRGK